MGKLKGKKRMTPDRGPRRHTDRSGHAGQDNVGGVFLGVHATDS
jgi:hypothetical protein